MSDGMDIAHSLHSEVTGLSFSFLSSEDIRSISVKKIDNPILLDNLGLPTRGGLYDPALGPMNSRDICETCKLTGFQCPGHFGHIELPSPVYHPLFMNQCYQLLRSVCLYCHHFKMPEITLKRYIARLRLLDAGCLEEAHYIADFHPVTKSKDGDEDVADQDVAAESAAQFIVRMEQYVKAVLKSKKKKHVRDDYKEDLVFQERRKVLNEFGKKAYARCSHCTAFGNTFRKEKAIKIIEYDLTPKQKMANQAANLRKTSPSFGKIVNKRKPKADADDEGIEGSEGSGPSEDEAMDVDEEEQEESEGDMDEDEGIVGDGIARTASGQVKGTRGRNERVMAPAEVRGHLRRLFELEREICTLLYGRHGAPSATHVTPPPVADMFFMDVIPVTPTRFRPPARMGDDLFENSQNSLLNAVISSCIRTLEINQNLMDLERQDKSEELMEQLKKLDKNRTFELLLESLIKLQNDVNSFMDSTKNPTVMKQGKLPPQGVKQLLEKKEGLFRKHMMGKRVNYAARSVISPDINVETNEIGIPPVFAKKLTYPEPVTPNNVAEMRQLVINGPKVHPGAAIVQNEDGSKISLDRMTLEQRTAIANQLLTPQNDTYGIGSSSGGPAARNKKVYRHIRDGDIVILNRQPTLHKPSMMCHRVKVLKGEKTIRMHYANCNSYNADFDGDEMNIHFPQNEIARAEAQMLANTDNQYLVPTSGAPLRGLIQDHVVAGVWMLNKSSFFTREEYYQLIYGALRTENNYITRSRIVTLPPAIWKPKPMWTGKQIISTILANLTPLNAKGLNLTSKNKVQNALWQRDDSSDPDMSEEKVIFVDGHLLCGILDKSQYGATQYGLVHSVHELYGPYVANRLLGVLSRLFTKYLQHTAFSCRMDDLVLTAEGEALRRKILDEGADDGRKTAMKFVGLPEAPADDKEAAANLNIRLEEILHDNDLMAGLDAAMQGSFNKTTSKINNDVLPAHLVRPFPYNNMQTMTISGAKGSKVNASQISTLLGQQALEGRRVPVMVSGKTLPAFKPFETAPRAGGYVANRFLTGVRPQEYYFHCMAGREGLIDTAVKTARSGYLQRCLIKHLEGVRVHYDHTVRDSDSSVLQFMYGEDGIDVTKSKHLEQFDFSCRNHDSLIQKFKPAELQGKVVMDEAVEHTKKALKKPHKYEPAMSVYSPSRYLGSMSEAYAKKVNNYVKENKQGLIRRKGGEDEQTPSPYSAEKVNERDFQQLARIRYMRSLVDPGEAVGLLASQGVGEPSTQMTLNTFHLAGHGAANVTLGIPRLREIVMTAAQKPATPTMKLPLREHITDDDVDMFTKQVTRLKLSEVVDKVTVTERLSGKSAEANNSRLRKYTVHLQFYPEKEYADEYKITKEQLHESLATSFAGRLKREIVNELRNAVKTKEQDMAVGKGLRMRSDDADEAPARRGRDEELDDEDDDEDSGQLKRQRQRKQHEYDEDEAESPRVVDLEDFVERDGDEDEDEDEDMDADPETKAAADMQADNLAELFKTAAKFATAFSFDTYKGESAEFELEFPGQAPKLLLVDIIERACRNSVVHEIDNIGRCMKVYDDKGSFTRELITEGSNLRGMWALADELVDLDRLSSNDVYAILKVYGVEAARSCILNEMSAVFGAYGIDVNKRHLYLIADYMTQFGGYKAFNRTGISSKSSVLLKASFETSTAFLVESTLAGDFDDLTSPAARIVMGKPAMSGTGSFDIRAPRHI